MECSFSKLEDGRWGVLVQDDLPAMGGQALEMAGREVQIGKRDGTICTQRLGTCVSQRNGGRGAQYTIKRDRPKPEQRLLPDVAEGHYALAAGDHVDFYQVQIGKEGTRWDGFVFLSRESGENHVPIKNYQDKRDLLEQIATDPVGAMQLYGQQIGRCGRCRMRLTDDNSRVLGIGPDCRKQLGI